MPGLRVFQIAHDNHADEGLELDVTFTLAGDGINGGFGVGVIASDARELGSEARLPCLKLSQLFGCGVVLGLGVRLDTHHFDPRLAEAVVVRLLGRSEGRFVVITGVGPVIDFLFATFNDFAVGRTKHLLTVDGSVFLDGAMDVGDGEFELCCSHMIVFVK